MHSSPTKLSFSGLCQDEAIILNYPDKPRSKEKYPYKSEATGDVLYGRGEASGSMKTERYKPRYSQLPETKRSKEENLVTGSPTEPSERAWV